MKASPWIMPIARYQGSPTRQARGIPQVQPSAMIFLKVKDLLKIIQSPTMSAGNPKPIGPFARSERPQKI